ncbi:homeobox domain-containing protein [Naegleria gruberi]|uniref:Homeobox domain-containing protein n=1 Tax=Naegleria gruberi TaxID=5762 RepID=D2VLZ8_NAEGR|nr:homeobox domain-containing protein [Naegleria gruberi]EFC42231.1 homeobox domain-containing protein [Naegleria gruberi]|eukprot:XP_002674975.1 homeobox domain-containing protein [Naegleria gruberi strain NEG-M]
MQSTTTIATSQSSLIETQEDKILDSPSLLHQYSESDSGCESDKADGKSKHGKKRKGYPKEITKVLNDWFFANLQNPYPSEDEKKGLVDQTTLSLLQINNWFSNKRVRYKRKMQKEGQEVVEGGVDINQAFRSIKKQKDKKEPSASTSTSATANTQSQTPKRKRSSATKDMQYTKKKRPTPLKTESTTSVTAKVVESSSSPLIKTPTIVNFTQTNSPTTVISTSTAAVQEPKNVLSSLLESPSNMNMNGNSVVLLRSPIINNEETKKTPDEKSTESPQPKQIDFFQSLQQAGVLFPQNTMTAPVIPVIQTMPTYHPYVVHNAAPFVDAISVPYAYPIYTPTYYPNQVIFMNKQIDENNFFEMDAGFTTEGGELDVQFEDAQASELFHTDLFSTEQEECFDENQWTSTNEDLLF